MRPSFLYPPRFPWASSRPRTEAIELLLQPGDRLTLYTDGVLEATNPDRELIGFNRMATLFATSGNAPGLAEAARAFGQEDDITVLTLSRLASAALAP